MSQDEPIPQSEDVLSANPHQHDQPLPDDQYSPNPDFTNTSEIQPHHDDPHSPPQTTPQEPEPYDTIAPHDPHPPAENPEAPATPTPTHTSHARSSLTLREDSRLCWDSSVRLSPLGLGWNAEPLVLDWFGHGHPDLLAVAEGQADSGPAHAKGWGARIYRYQPGRSDLPGHYDEGRDVPALAGLRCVAVLPHPGPARFDLVGIDEVMGLVHLENQGTQFAPKFGPRHALGFPADLGIGPGIVRQLFGTDYNGDGRTDLLVGYDHLNDYWPDGDAVPPAQQVGFNQRAGHPGYNAKGQWRGKPPRGGILWLENMGGSPPVFHMHHEIGNAFGRLDLHPRPAPLLVSWTNRVSVEILVTDGSERLRVFRNFGGQRPPVLMEPRVLQRSGSKQPLLLPSNRTSVTVGNFEEDGRTSLVFGSAEGWINAVHPGARSDQADPPIPLLQEGRTLRTGGHSTVTVGDLDNDGDWDLVVGDASGRLFWIEDVGTPGDPRHILPVALETGGAPFCLDSGADGMLEGPAGLRLGHAKPLLADWNNHGRLDLILSGAGGDVWYVRNNGGRTQPRFDRPRAITCQGDSLILPPKVRPAVARWLEPGDGEPDLIGLDLQGFLCVYPRLEALDVDDPVRLRDLMGRWIRLDGGFGQSGGVALWVGHFTGGPAQEILVGLPRGHRHVLPPLVGQPLRDVNDWPTVLLLQPFEDDPNTLVARPLYHRNGRPVVIGVDGCAPAGVPADGYVHGPDQTRKPLDLLVGGDDGYVSRFRHEDLRY